MAVVHALRPDRTMAAAANFVEKVFVEGAAEDGGGEDTQDAGSALPWDEALDLDEAVRDGARPEAPVLLCSEAGHDASWKVVYVPAWSMNQPFLDKHIYIYILILIAVTVTSAERYGSVRVLIS